MGRPLNKKYFGNRNVGAPNNTADDGIGGKSVASIPVTTVGSYTTRPTVALTGAPDLLSGIAATATITSEALTGAVTTAGSGYTSGDLITLSTDGGSALAYVTGIGAGGSISGVNFTNAAANRGSFEALPGAKIVATGGSGTGAEITVTFRAKSVTVIPGSGYTTTVPTAAASGGSVVLGTVVMTSPTNNTATSGSGFNPDSAIIAYAYTGSGVKQADIVKQVSKDRYKVNTSDTTGVSPIVPVIAKLKTDGAAAQLGEMTIKATDSLTKTYYIQKLTAHKAVIVPYGTNGHEFPLINGVAQQVPWSFSTAVTGTVQIENG